MVEVIWSGGGGGVVCVCVRVGRGVGVCASGVVWCGMGCVCAGRGTHNTIQVCTIHDHKGSGDIENLMNDFTWWGGEREAKTRVR